jgi:hypothetical protein
MHNTGNYQIIKILTIRLPFCDIKSYFVLKMKLPYFLTLIISVIITTTSLLSTQSRAQYVKVPEAEMPEIESAWDAVVKVEKTNKGSNFLPAANQTFLCAWKSIIPPDNTEEYWTVANNKDDIFLLPIYREATFNKLGIINYDYLGGDLYNCPAQATAMCDQGPSGGVTPPCPPVCTRYIVACSEECPPPKVADVSCSSTSVNNKIDSLSASCGCDGPFGPSSSSARTSAVAMASWMCSLVFAAVMMLL